MARVDLHLHTEYSPDSVSGLQAVDRRAQRVGLTHLAVTDHNTIAGALRMKEVASLPVIVGEEIMTARGEMIGLFLSELVPPGMSPHKTAEMIHQQGGLVYVPHPLDPLRHGLGEAGVRELGPAIDVIEVFNARCVRASSNAAAARLADLLPVARSAASDAHSLFEIGRSYVEGPDFSDAPGLKRCLQQGLMHARRSPAAIHLLSRYAAIRHRLRSAGPP
ncbi:MAG TPA: PHP domain-containing protein [Candidatus Limnocylindrales bacterium]|nr:PHP domain-containing protein [Candidatus Limnocylindrales bacterium]